MAAELYVRVIDELIASPFPAAGYHDDHGQGGPGHHLRILQASEDFWEDDDGTAFEVAYTRMEAELAALTAMLAARWGEPRTVDLGQYWTLASAGKDPLPEPLKTLSQLAESMQLWALPGTGHWLGLTIAQEDKELRLELLAAVGEASALTAGEAARQRQAAQALGRSGKYAAARDQFAALLSAHEQVLGPEHPSTLADRANLAYWTGSTGDAAGARDLYAALLAVHERVLGPEHPSTLLVRGNLARWTGEAGDAAGARDQFTGLLAVHERVLGLQHPVTRKTRDYLARWTGEAGDAG